MSHGSHDDHARRIAAIRALEKRARPADHDPRRPAGARSCASAGSRATRRCSRPARRFVFDRDDTLGDATRRQPAAPRDFRRRSSRARGCWSTTASSSSGSSRPTPDRIEADGRGRRHDLQQQGPQRPRRGAAARRADRQGPRRPRLRARPACRLDRALLRAAARGRRRGAAADRRQGEPARQDREAGRDRPARRTYWSWPTR